MNVIREMSQVVLLLSLEGLAGARPPFVDFGALVYVAALFPSSLLHHDKVRGYRLPYQDTYGTERHLL